jgi:MFS family permease
MQAFLLDQYGWQSAFWLGAIMPVFMLPIIIFAVPETLRFLVARNPDDKRIPPLLRRMDPKGEEVRVVPVARAAGAPEKDSVLRALFGDGRLAVTIFLWLAFMSSFAFISAGNWRTTLFHNIVGLDFKNVAIATSLGSAVGVVGNIVLGIAIDRWGFLKVLPTAFFIAAVTNLLMGMASHDLALFFSLLVVMNFFQHGSQAALGALASVLYPSGQSATGVGWAYGAGRIASIFAPLIGTFALKEHLSPLGVFALFSVPLATGAVFSFLAINIGKPMRKPVRTGGH